MTDPISDLLSRIRNGLAARKSEVVLPMSKVKFNIAKILVDEGWVTSAEAIKDINRKDKNPLFSDLKIVLKYKKNGKPVISDLKRISKPGRRVYKGKTELPRVLNNLGFAIISTPLGLMTNKQARKKGVGGEIMCEIY